jgi:uncharacterized damage-inducible protein DinB
MGAITRSVGAGGVNKPADGQTVIVDNKSGARADARYPDRTIRLANGGPARMTRGEMLLHVAMHAAGHRGQAALLLQKNGIQPWPDRITDFLAADDAGTKAQAA